jgi:hypothetical protein
MGGMVARMSFRLYLTWVSISKYTMDMDLWLDSTILETTELEYVYQYARPILVS